jgi:hypothetical protein
MKASPRVSIVSQNVDPTRRLQDSPARAAQQSAIARSPRRSISRVATTPVCNTLNTLNHVALKVQLG